MPTHPQISCLQLPPETHFRPLLDLGFTSLPVLTFPDMINLGFLLPEFARSLYLFCLGSALLPYYGHWIHPLPIFIRSHFHLSSYWFLLLNVTPLMDVPIHRFPAMVDSDSITLGTRSINFPATSNNFYIPVSSDRSYQARLAQGERRGCHIEAHGEK